jgi:hypothetical protein
MSTMPDVHTFVAEPTWSKHNILTALSFKSEGWQDLLGPGYNQTWDEATCTSYNRFLHPHSDLLNLDEDEIRTGFMFYTAARAAALPAVTDKELQPHDSLLHKVQPALKHWQVHARFMYANATRAYIKCPAGVRYQFQRMRTKMLANNYSSLNVFTRALNVPRPVELSPPEHRRGDLTKHNPGAHPCASALRDLLQTMHDSAPLSKREAYMATDMKTLNSHHVPRDIPKGMPWEDPGVNASYKQDVCRPGYRLHDVTGPVVPPLLGGDSTPGGTAAL